MLVRREVLAGIAATLAAPTVARSDVQRPLRFVPRTDLAILDPIWSSAIITRNHGFMIYDTLFGQDADFEPSPQMLAGYRVENDGRTWRLVLREGLLWHDGEAVLARDCTASIQRWAARDAFGQALMAATDELSAADDRTIVFRLKKPFPFLPHALGKSAAYFPAMMPARLAAVGPDRPVTEIVGSGPFRYRADERVPGARNVYERFAGYRPREDGHSSRTAGPKRACVERVEWITMSDPTTAVAALRAGEVDWVDYPMADHLPMLRASPGVTVRTLDPKGLIGVFRMNHLQPPFDNPAIRRAVLAAFDQAEFMQAAVGEDDSLWRDRVGFFCPGSPLATVMPATAPDRAAAKRAVAAAGYRGEPVALIVSSDFPTLKAMSDVAAATMEQIGLNVDYQALDWGTVQQRRHRREPVGRGGWSAFVTNYEGADLVDPAVHLALRTNGPQAWFGWPDDPVIEGLRDAWFDAGSVADQRALAAKMQQEALVNVPYIPLGQFSVPTAYRSDLQGMVDGFAIFWNVRRAG